MISFIGTGSIMGISDAQIRDLEMWKACDLWPKMAKCTNMFFRAPMMEKVEKEKEGN